MLRKSKEELNISEKPYMETLNSTKRVLLNIKPEIILHRANRGQESRAPRYIYTQCQIVGQPLHYRINA